MRIAVAAAVEIGLLAVAAQGVLSDRTALLALVLAPVGYLVSYRRRSSTNVAIKVALALGLFVATARFLGQIGYVTSPDAARAPLAALFLWVQVLHAFDVPRRRDLSFSMVSSTTMIAVGGALALSTSYLWWLLAWAVASRCVVVDVVPAARRRPAARDDRARARRPQPRGAGAIGRRGGRRGARAGRGRVRAHAAPPVDDGAVDAVPDVAGRAARAGRSRPEPDVASGLGRRTGRRLLVERVSGVQRRDGPACTRRCLSDDVVFRVRASFPQLWRAEVFDTYDGSLWTQSHQHLVPLVSNDSGGYDVPGSDGFNGPTKPLVQTFFLEQAQPNVLFAAAQPQTVYFPSGALRTTADLSIRAPIYLDQGLVYSVESAVPDIPDAMLAQLPPMRPLPAHGYDARFLQLPDELPQRDRDLADQITAGRAQRVRRGDGRAVLAPGEHAVRPHRAARAAGRRRGGSLPVRHPPRVLRTHRFGDGGAAAGRGDPDADRHGVRAGGAQPVHRLRRRAVLRRARVGRGALSGPRLAALRPDLRGARRARAGGARRSAPGSCRGSRRRSARRSPSGCGPPSAPPPTG